MKRRKKIAVIYHDFPHYRSAIVETLASSKQYEYIFIGSERSVNPTIRSMVFSGDIKFLDAPCRKLGVFLFQPSAYKHLAKEKIDGIILLGNAWHLSYWSICLRCLVLNKPVWMWTHGWINSREMWIKRQYRNLFYRLSKGLFLYGQRAKNIGLTYGFHENRLYVIGNSLDFSGMSKVFARIRETERSEIKRQLGLPVDKSIIICSARLTALCRFDILIEAVAGLDSACDQVVVVLVGDGPEREALERQSESLGVDTRFIGACYDEEVIARYYHCSDISVSPGKVGLTAVHSMTYGTPVISHNNLDRQMPEIEAIEPGVTGDLYEYGNTKHLSEVILRWLNIKSDRPEVIERCIRVIETRFSPAFQVKVIEKAISAYWE